MVKPFVSYQFEQSKELKVLFVDVHEQDSASLTRGGNARVVAVSATAQNAVALLQRERFDALVLQVGTSDCNTVRHFKKSANTPLLMLADGVEVPKAVQFVKQGADGFVLRGITTPASFVHLTQVASRNSQNTYRE